MDMTSEIERLKNEVAAEHDLEISVRALITNLGDQIHAAAGAPAAGTTDLANLVDALHSQDAELAAAVLANTPADPNNATASTSAPASAPASTISGAGDGAATVAGANATTTQDPAPPPAAA